MAGVPFLLQCHEGPLGGSVWQVPRCSKSEILLKWSSRSLHTLHEGQLLVSNQTDLWTTMTESMVVPLRKCLSQVKACSDIGRTTRHAAASTQAASWSRLAYIPPLRRCPTDSSRKSIGAPLPVKCDDFQVALEHAYGPYAFNIVYYYAWHTCVAAQGTGFKSDRACRSIAQTQGLLRRPHLRWA